jgi:uncharacterized protein (UPF0212 family)
MRHFVTCPKCKERFDAAKVKFLNIEEDFQGYDVMTFECPKCKTEEKAYVRGN